MQTDAATTHPSFSGLSAPAPLDRPMRKGRVVRVPESWSGPLSHAPFEAVLSEGGQICLGVGLTCPKGRLKPGALWILCADGAELLTRAQALDAALALIGHDMAGHGSDLDTSKGKIAGVPAMRLLETLLWMEAGAGRQTGQDGACAGIWVSGARSLFADKARGLKKALESRLPAGVVALAEPSPSPAMH